MRKSSGIAKKGVRKEAKEKKKAKPRKEAKAKKKAEARKETKAKKKAKPRKERKAPKAPKEHGRAHFFFLFATVFLIDQLTKFFIARWPPGKRIEVIPNLFWLTHATNTGVSFGLFPGNNMLMGLLAVMILGILLYFYDRFELPLERAAWWLIIAGLFGNLIDRIVRGAVVDMFNLGWWPIFNIADSAIFIAVGVLIIAEWRRWFAEKKGTKEERNKRKKLKKGTKEL